MTTTSTHDTKRSEDVRAWLNVLSEIPDEWTGCVDRWREWNESRKTKVDGVAVPDANEEYLLYQTLFGTWPMQLTTDSSLGEYADRIAPYMQKALREAKVHTSWVNPNDEYESAIDRFVRNVLSRGEENPFLDDMIRLRERLNLAGMVNALGQVLLKICIPGVPDFYQGCELWGFHLVDPDNRRPVDYKQREQMLNEIQRREHEDLHGLIGDMLYNWSDGRVKLFTTFRALNFRRYYRALFLDGEYLPVEAVGSGAEHVCSFLRCSPTMNCWVVVPRFTMKLTNGERLPLGPEVWQDTTMPVPRNISRLWRNVLTGDMVEARQDGQRMVVDVASALGRFPIALLESQPG